MPGLDAVIDVESKQRTPGVIVELAQIEKRRNECVKKMEDVRCFSLLYKTRHGHTAEWNNVSRGTSFHCSEGSAGCIISVLRRHRVARPSEEIRAIRDSRIASKSDRALLQIELVRLAQSAAREFTDYRLVPFRFGGNSRINDQETSAISPVSYSTLKCVRNFLGTLTRFGTATAEILFAFLIVLCGSKKESPSQTRCRTRFPNRHTVRV